MGVETAKICLAKKPCKVLKKSSAKTEAVKHLYTVFLLTTADQG